MMFLNGIRAERGDMPRELEIDWPLVAAMLATYAVLTHFVKVWFTRRWGL
jgi:hypothetical protein